MLFINNKILNSITAAKAGYEPWSFHFYYKLFTTNIACMFCIVRFKILHAKSKAIKNYNAVMSSL